LYINILYYCHFLPWPFERLQKNIKRSESQKPVKNAVLMKNIKKTFITAMTFSSWFRGFCHGCMSNLSTANRSRSPESYVQVGLQSTVESVSIYVVILTTPAMTNISMPISW